MKSPQRHKVKIQQNRVSLMITFLNMTAQWIRVNALYFLSKNFCFYCDFNANLLSDSRRNYKGSREPYLLVQSMNEKENFHSS